MSKEEPFTPAAISKADAAKYIGISVASLERLMVRDTAPIPFVKLGARVVFRVKAIDAWLLSQEIKSVDDYRRLTDGRRK